jgi:hypothetical protein
MEAIVLFDTLFGNIEQIASKGACNIWESKPTVAISGSFGAYSNPAD